MKKIYVVLAFVFSSLSAFSQAPAWAWARGAGGTADDEPYCVAADAFGNVYMAGFFSSSSITFGTTTLWNSGGFDIYVVKYDGLGSVLWAKSVGGVGAEQATSVCVDPAGYVYVGGYFGSPSLTFGTSTVVNVSGDDVLLLKYDASGNEIWAKSAGGDMHEVISSIAADGLGGLYVSGTFNSDSVRFGAATILNHGSIGSYDVFFAKYDTAGNPQWAKSAGGAYNDISTGVATDHSGHAYVTGYFISGTISFGSTTLTNTGTAGGVPGGSRDIFLAKYDSSGNAIWARKQTAGGYTDDYANAVTTDPSGNVYLTGYFLMGPLVFDTDSLNTSGNDMYIVKFDSAGHALWAKSPVISGSVVPNSITADPTGNVYATGYFSGSSIIFGTDTLAPPGGTARNAFVVKYDAYGNAVWAKSATGYGVGVDVEGSSVASDPVGNIFMAGKDYGISATFGSVVLTNAGAFDSYLAKVGTSPLAESWVSREQAVLEIYPNPFSLSTDVVFSKEQKNTMVTVTDIYGREIRKINFTGTRLIIDKGDMASGVYLVHVVDEKNNVACRKILVQ